MPDWTAPEDVLSADIVVDIAIDVVLELTMIGPP